MKPFTIVGRRAVYTRVTSKYDEAKREMVETGRQTFSGTVAALVVIGGSSRYPAIVMLYDDGSMRVHDVTDVTLEAAPGDGAYR